MPTTITSSSAIEKNTAIIQCVFTDEDGSAVAPKTLTWTLTDASGTVINSREDVAVGAPADTTYIVLSGDDLQIVNNKGNNEDRILTVEGTYDSAYGNDLPVRDSVLFTVQNLVAVT
jgi:hypothetical protein